VLVWKNSSGLYTASLVEFEELAAVASTQRAALQQLKELLVWRHRKNPQRDHPALHHAELVQFRVMIRPEYRDPHSGRVSPVPQSIEVRVPCVLCRQPDGYQVASMPMLPLRLELSGEEEARKAIPTLVERWFERTTPRDLSRFVPPDQVVLETIHLNLQPRDLDRIPRIAVQVLPQVADALGEPRVRRHYGKAWERDEEVQVFASQLRRERGNWLLVGPGGSGKTTLLCEVVRAVERQLDQEQRDQGARGRNKPARRFWQTSAGRLIAGMRYLGQTEERLEKVIAELDSIEGFLCLENLLAFVTSAGEDVTAGIAAFCLPYAQRGELRIIAETTPEELDACRRLMPGLIDLFQVRALKPLGPIEGARILDRVAESHTPARQLQVVPQATADVVRLFQRFQPYHALPGEAVTFWKGLLDRIDRSQDREVTREKVVQAYLRRTGLPEVFLRDELPLVMESVREQFSTEIKGQPHACAAAAQVLVQFKAGMNDPRRPLGVLLFCGPTGVGKTELVKALARGLFGAGEEDQNRRPAGLSRLIRLDMSEYSGPWGADRLLLQSNGEPSPFVQQIRRQPFSVVLFDEIEKAHPAVCDVLMDVFDEGRLTDRFGRVTWFRSAVLVMTSNLGSDFAGAVGFGGAGVLAASHHEAAVREYFRPEFFNRIDDLVIFNPLSEEAILEITEMELNSIAQREGFRRLGVTLTWTPEVMAFLAREGIDPRYGARPLQRTLETLVVAPLAARLLDAKDRPTAVRCVLREGKVVLES
jgi:ATP-dependent Clp protease ATP-binding subunit ClpC